MRKVYSIFAGVAMAIHMCVAAATLSLSPDLEPRDTTFVVQKTVTSSTMRFMFTVGLEGSGHHYVLRVQKHLFDTHQQLERISHDDVVKFAPYFIHSSMAGNVQQYRSGLRSARETMHNLAQRGEELEIPGTLTFMDMLTSYPSGFGPDKALKYLDLRMLAEVAEEEGVDLRVLYLRRSAKDLLIANTIHRKFQNSIHKEKDLEETEKNYMGYMQILLTDVAVVHSFLEELGPGFVVCHDYGRVGDVDQSAKIAEFLAPNAEVAAMLNDSLVEVATAHAPSNESQLYDGADVIAARLQRKFDTFEAKICSGT